MEGQLSIRSNELGRLCGILHLAVKVRLSTCRVKRSSSVENGCLARRACTNLKSESRRDCGSIFTAAHTGSQRTAEAVMAEMLLLLLLPLHYLHVVVHLAQEYWPCSKWARLTPCSSASQPLSPLRAVPCCGKRTEFSPWCWRGVGRSNLSQHDLRSLHSQTPARRFSLREADLAGICA